MKQGIYTITANEALTKDVWRMVLAGDTSAMTAPGQFVEISLPGFFLRRPISVCDYDENSITIIYKVVGQGTDAMTRLVAGDTLDVLCGLGNGFDPAKAGDAPVLVGGGVGVPPLYNLAKKLLAAGKKPVVILGFNKAEEIFYAEEFKALGAEVIVTTVDGSVGVKGIVTDLVRGRLDSEGDNISEVVAVGPVPMMQAVADLTRSYGTPTTVSLNSLMVDGLGMCGACRVTVGGQMKFTCVDGPEFDGHKVDFAELRSRLGSFRTQEAVARENRRCTCMDKLAEKKED
jgi:NAD(P)H-flavin reductase